MEGVAEAVEFAAFALRQRLRGGGGAVGAAPRQGFRGRDFAAGAAAETVFIPAARVEQCRGTMPCAPGAFSLTAMFF